jgi:excisionase family DNA binding protein
VSVEPLPAHGWVSISQLADHLGVSRETIRRWRDEEGLPGVRIGSGSRGGTVRFYMPDVFEWLREHRSEAGA